MDVIKLHLFVCMLPPTTRTLCSSRDGVRDCARLEGALPACCPLGLVSGQLVGTATSGRLFRDDSVWLRCISCHHPRSTPSACPVRLAAAEPLEPAFEFLSAYGNQARSYRGVNSEIVCSELRAAIGGIAGESLVRALILGLSDSLPVGTVPRVADVLAPLLHVDSWRGSIGSWVHGSLAQIPTQDGVPGQGTCTALLQVLGSLPDAYEGGNVHLDVVDELRRALLGFARVCRRMQSAADLSWPATTGSQPSSESWPCPHIAARKLIHTRTK